jgi:segregation and condensation protein B
MANRSEANEEREENVVADAEASQPAAENEAAENRPALSEQQKAGLLEALLLASGDPISIARIQEILSCSKADVLALADNLQKSCSAEDRGIEVVVVAEKLQLRTKALYADYVRQLMAVRPRRLSQAALETLSVIAYQQPVVKSEIDKIRGVDVAPTIKTLLERNLVKIIGYQASVGQPALYGTTEDFLKVFGLSSLAALPAMRDLKALAKEPGEALESEASAENDDIEEPAVEEPVPSEPTQEGGETTAH